MHNILEIAIGVALGMVVFLVVAWLLGTVVYICCGNSKKIATVRKIKNYNGVKISEPIVDEKTVPEEKAIPEEVKDEKTE